MAFTRQHGQISDVANLAAKAGAAVQEVNNRKQELDLAKFQMAQTHEKESELRRLQHDLLTRQYEADMQFEARKAQRAWELEKEMMRSRAAFDVQLQQEMQHEQLINQQIRAVNDAFENGRISQDDLTALTMKIKTGYVPPSMMGQKGTPADGMDSLLQQMMGGQPADTAPKQQLVENRPTSTEDEIPYSTITMADGTVYEYRDGKMVQVTDSDGQSHITEPSPKKEVLPELQPQPGQARSGLAQIAEPAYHKTGWGIFGKTTANIPAMEAKITALIDSPRLDEDSKADLQRILALGNEKAIQSYYEQLVQGGYLPKEQPVKKQRQTTLSNYPAVQR